MCSDSHPDIHSWLEIEMKLIRALGRLDSHRALGSWTHTEHWVGWTHTGYLFCTVCSPGVGFTLKNK